MKRIFKYKLEMVLFQTVEMPQGAEILCIQMQNESPCIWALVEPNATVTERTFQMVGTGQDIGDYGERKYLGTIQLNVYVFHCFELVEQYYKS
ncbi:MAG: hypothetical protein ABI237_05980 [Ginsengibacter sp.]